MLFVPVGVNWNVFCVLYYCTRPCNEIYIETFKKKKKCPDLPVQVLYIDTVLVLVPYSFYLLVLKVVSKIGFPLQQVFFIVVF
jgi:hypothetical protein